MTIEQIRELSELTDIAVEKNDIESLNKIYQTLLKYQTNDAFGIEWFTSSMSAEQWKSIRLLNK